MDEITPLTDTALLASVHESAFDTPWSEAEFAALMGKSGARAFGTADGFILVQGLGGGALGADEMSGQEAEIITLAVRPPARRAGLAARLIAHAQAAMAVVRIFLEVAADNEAARTLYQKHGFVVTGRRKAYYKRADARRVDAVLMQGDFPPAM